MPDELAVAQLAGYIEVLGKVEGTATDAIDQSVADLVEALRLALAASVDATQLGHDLLYQLVFERSMHRVGKSGWGLVILGRPDLRVVGHVVLDGLPYPMAKCPTRHG